MTKFASINSSFFSMRIMAFCFVLVFGRNPCQAIQGKQTNTPSVKSPAASASMVASTGTPKPTMMMPMVAPLFVADGQTSSVLTLVQDLQEEATVDVAVLDRLGTVVVTFPITIPPHGEQTVQMNERLQQMQITVPILGSLTVTPRNTVQLGAQLSYTQSTGSGESYFEEELVMLSPSARNVFRSVATGAIESPILAVKSLASTAQTVTVSCLEEQHPRKTKTLQLGPQSMKVISGCHNSDAGVDSWPGTFDFKESQPRVVGISVESSGTSEGLAVFGLAPRSQSVYESLAFTQIDALRSADTVFEGVPVGPTKAFSYDEFEPELGVANFQTIPAHVKVSYVSHAANPNTLKVIADVLVAPLSSSRVALGTLVGDQNMQNSFIVSTDAVNGQILSTLRSTKQNRQFTEIPREDMKKATDGGGHPWSLDQNISSYLILFNADKVAHSVGIFAYPENAAQVTKRVMIDPNQTMALDIGSLFVESPNSTGSKADPGKPSTSKPKGDGIVTWLSLEGNNIFGRVVQISANQAWSRNFSCPVEYIACAATVFPSSTTLSVGTSAPLYGYANICPSSGQCTCDGSGSCTYTTQQVSTNVWSVDNSAIASFSGSVYNQSATIVGNQAGQTNVQLNVQDDSDYACFGSTTMAYGNPGALTVTVCPSTILYTQSVTPSLSSNDPPYLTGMGIVAVMTGSAGSAGAQISEAVSLQSSTCGPNYQIDCGGSPAVAIASGGPVPFQGTVLPGVTDGFYDVHEAVNTIDVLGTLGLNSCTFTCIQTYSCQGAPLGKFSIQYNLNHGNGVTNVTATKTATN